MVFKISDSWLKWNKTMEIKQNRTFCNGTYSSLMSFFIGRKMLKYFNDFFDWHLSISLHKWVQTKQNEIKSKGIFENLTEFLLTKCYGIWMTFEMYLWVRFISKMNTKKLHRKHVYHLILSRKCWRHI